MALVDRRTVVTSEDRKIQAWKNAVIEPTAAERERIVKIMSEAAEIVHACSKILDYGFESKNPTDPLSVTNRQKLEQEIGDFYGAVELSAMNSDIDHNVIAQLAIKKQAKMKLWMRHQG